MGQGCHVGQRVISAPWERFRRFFDWQTPDPIQGDKSLIGLEDAVELAGVGTDVVGRAGGRAGRGIDGTGIGPGIGQIGLVLKPIGFARIGSPGDGDDSTRQLNVGDFEFASHEHGEGARVGERWGTVVRNAHGDGVGGTGVPIGWGPRKGAARCTNGGAGRRAGSRV